MMGSRTSKNAQNLSRVEESSWGEKRNDNFGYASDEERLAKRGLEDWELVETIPESQKKIPFWFIGVTVAVLLVAVGLSFPFWGLRPGDNRPWVDWGFIAAIFYVAAGSFFVRFMVNLYGSTLGGRLDSDKNCQEPPGKPDAQN
uniref:Uncharacterized protein n=1 Tax=Candidatus Nitrotoga fabula TaxID=2182327 RepID=A0A2X0SHQ8_9PROT|nr:conserved protein of unknown function [Candidatus Nitrotoga fabula]